MKKSFYLILCGGFAAFLTGCQTEDKTETSAQKPAPVVSAPAAPAQLMTVTPAAPAQPAASAQAAPVTSSTVRVRAGASAPFKDSAGNTWQADTGFEGGDVVERPDTAIANTKDQGLYQAEHYSMTSYSCKIPNGKYIVKLHFAETYDGITGPGERVFSMNVQGHEIKDFDTYKKAGGSNRAYVETVPVEVTNGTFKIDFTANVENPQINAIEITPAS